MTQRERIHAMLRDAGPRGVHSFEFFEQRMPRAAAVICVLRQEGMRIESQNERHHGGAMGVRYVLCQPVRHVAPAPVDDSASLFDLGPAASSAYDLRNEAA